ncbi:hypothetical protein K438DRAFT_1605221, partial [Mycena galopus ATCC 62051]
SSQVAEIAAALEAVRATNQEAELTMVCMNNYISNAMTRKLAQWEHEGWVGVRHSKVLKCLAAELKVRKARTTFVVATPGSIAQMRCHEAAKLAKLGTRSPRVYEITLDIPAGTVLTGVRLQGNRQKTFYRGIRGVKNGTLEVRPATNRKLTQVKNSLRQIRDRLVTDEEIWRSIRDKAFAPRISQFLWKTMHNAHRIGHYWMHIPECEDRATCQECGEEENIEHILLHCRSPGQEIVSKAAEKLWKERKQDWPEVTLGGILGCGLIDFKGEGGKPERGTQRLYKILISESMYTIWKIRNKRVISRSGDPLAETAIVNKWVSNLNQCLQQDIMLANRPKGSKRPHLAPSLVHETWSGILDDEGNLPENWLKGSRVLVGRRALTHDQLRNRGVG